MNTKKIYKIKGFDCASCAAMLEMDMEEAGIAAKCSYPLETLEVDEESDQKKVIEIVKKSGYSISNPDE
jgi:copper chaperone CopZ